MAISEKPKIILLKASGSEEFPKDEKGKINLFYDHFCIVSRFCQTYQKLASFLFFLYMIDKRFLMGFKIAYSRLFSNKVAHKEFFKASGKAFNKTLNFFIIFFKLFKYVLIDKNYKNKYLFVFKNQ